MAVGNLAETCTDGCLSLGDVLSVRKAAHKSNSHWVKKEMRAINGDKCTAEDQNMGYSQSEPTKLPLVSKEEVVLAGENFIKGLGAVMTRWVEATSVAADSAGKTRQMTHFHSVRAPSMSVEDYLKRIHKYFLSSDECYVIALVLIDRVGKIDPAMTVCELNVHRLLVLAAMIAAKFHDDVYYSNAYYAKVGGLSLKEVNALEAKLLKTLDWKVFVHPEEYQLYHGLVCQATSLTKEPRKKTHKEPEPEPPVRRGTR